MMGGDTTLKCGVYFLADANIGKFRSSTCPGLGGTGTENICGNVHTYMKITLSVFWEEDQKSSFIR